MGWLRMQDFLTLEVKGSENKKFLFECKDSKSPSGVSLFIKTEATHSGIVNGNARFYRPDRMQDGTGSWTPKGKPLKPVLVNHNKDGECMGRVHKARYVDLSYQYTGEFPGVKGLCFYDSSPKKLNLFNSVDWVLRNLHGKPDYKGLGYIELDMNITDPGAIQKVQDDRFLTVSVGFGTDAAVCSICHTDWAVDDKCDHELGQAYDGKPMFLISGNIKYKEVSFVNFPADPWGVVTSKDSIKQIADSVANRVFFMGLSTSEQHKRFAQQGTDSLIYSTDSISFLGSDICPMEDEIDIEEETDMDLKAIQAEIKSKDLTKDRAIELRKELEASDDQAGVKRTLTGLIAKIRANNWTDSTTSKESVEVRIAGLDAHLATLPEADREAYLAALEADAQAFGIDFRRAPAAEPPAAAAEPKTEVAPPPAAADAVVVIDPKVIEGIDALLAVEDSEKKYPNKEKLLKTVESVQALHGACNEDERYMLRSALSSLIEVFYADNYLQYAKKRIEEAGDAVISQSELDELHTAVEHGEKALKQAEADKAALLTTNLNMVKDQKITIARVVVAGHVLLAKPGFAGLTADQIQTEISDRSKRGLNSLQDSLTDLLREFPGKAVQAASDATPKEGAVREVSDNASIADADGAVVPAVTEATPAESELNVDALSKIVGTRVARNMAARERFKKRVASTPQTT